MGCSLLGAGVTASFVCEGDGSRCSARTIQYSELLLLIPVLNFHIVVSDIYNVSGVTFCPHFHCRIRIHKVLGNP
jgi:hypothetical protein